MNQAHKLVTYSCIFSHVLVKWFLFMSKEGLNLDFKPFVASKDMADAVKMEVSAATPKQDLQVVQVGVKEIVNTMLNLYGRFMPKECILRVRDAHQRTFVVNDNDFSLMYNEWSTNRDSREPEEVGGFCVYEGHVTIIRYPHSVSEFRWETIPSETRTRWLEKYPDEIEARRAYSDVQSSFALTHETLHQFHTKNIPDFFAHCAIPYYQRELDKSLTFSGYTKNESYEIASEFYSILISKFGDVVHKVFFGLPVDNEKRDDIILFLNLLLHFARKRGVDLKGIFEDVHDVLFKLGESKDNPEKWGVKWYYPE